MRYDDDSRRRLFVRDPGLHGTARWATRAHLAERGYGPGGRFVFGYAPPERAGEGAYPVTYGGARHGITVAPNRSGKGVSTCIPALMSHPGSAIVLDPRGEITAATARFREQVLGQKIAIYDPYNVICADLGRDPDRFNVFDGISPDSPTFFDDAYLSADALVMPEEHSSRFWSDESRALNVGGILNVAADPREAGNRHLGRVRELLNMPTWEFHNYVGGTFEDDPQTGEKRLVRPGMLQSKNAYVSAAAGRILSKPERQFGDILATAQQNTHFLESQLVQDSLSASDFDFRDLAGGNMTIYLVLPPERLRTHGRLLRLLTSVAINTINKMPVKPEPSVLFMLDEMGALGRLDILLDAFGLLAGSGMQLHPIFQDFAQIQSLYGNRWQTFIANAAVVQAFGTRDLLTAEYISKLCGVGTVEQVTYESAVRRQGLLGDPAYFTREDALAGRPLITPDELMTLHPAVQVLVLANAHPAACFKAPYFLDARFRDRQERPLFDLPPRYRDRPLPRVIDFVRQGANLMHALAPYMSVG